MQCEHRKIFKACVVIFNIMFTGVKCVNYQNYYNLLGNPGSLFKLDTFPLKFDRLLTKKVY